MEAFLGFVGLCAVGAFILYAVGVYNRLNQLREGVRSADQTFNASVKRKQALVTEIAELAERVAFHEHRTHTALAAAVTDAAKELASSNRPSLILADLALRFPQLRHDRVFANAQSSAVQIEGQIDSSLTARNRLAENYNVAMRAFPASIVAGFLDFSAFDYRSDEAETEFDSGRVNRSNTRKDLEERLEQAMKG